MSETDISTAAVERLLDGVTEGPWEQEGPTSSKIVWAGPELRVCFLTSDGPSSKNARFIAASRDMVPALLADRDRLQRENDNLRQIERNVQAVREHEHQRANAAEADRDRLAAEVARLKEAVIDAESTLEAWFDRRELGHEAVDQAVIDAASGYLRTSRVGGMPQEESDLILGVMQNMARLGMFADLFARAAHAAGRESEP